MDVNKFQKIHSENKKTSAHVLTNCTSTELTNEVKISTNLRNEKEIKTCQVHLQIYWTKIFFYRARITSHLTLTLLSNGSAGALFENTSKILPPFNINLY